MAVSIDTAALGTIVILTVFDLGLRYLAFRRLDSVAIDLAFFAATYSAGSLFSSDLSVLEVTEGSPLTPLTRFLVCLVTLIILLALHAMLLSNLGSSIRDKLMVARRKIADDPNLSKNAAAEKQAAFEDFEKVAVKATMLTFSDFIPLELLRQGKRDARDEIVAAANRISGEVLTGRDFVLRKRDQFFGLVGFTFLGLLSLVAATLQLD